MNFVKRAKAAPVLLWIALFLYTGGSLLGLATDMMHGGTYSTADGQIVQMTLFSMYAPFILSVLFSFLLLCGSRVVFVLVSLSSLASLVSLVGADLGGTLERILQVLGVASGLCLAMAWKFFFHSRERFTE